jgi:hypothetical protein
MNLGFVRNANDFGNVHNAILEFGLYIHTHGFEHVQVAIEQFDDCQIATLIRID